MNGAPLKVFISYAHDDEPQWRELEKHLAQLRNDEAIVLWRDHEIVGGEEWEKEIFAELEAADIVLLVISASFLASHFCYHREMKRALARHEAGTARVVPIIFKPCDWQTADFAKLHALPAKAKPFTKWTNRDEAGLSVAQGIRRVVEDLCRRPVVKASTPAIFSVPYPRNPYFTGREDALAKIADQLATGGRSALSQVAAISGLGGIGKTQTAVEFAYRHREQYKAVFFVRSETATELLDGFAAMAELLGLPGAKGQDQGAAAQAAQRWLAANEGWLLIFDNADTPSLVARYLPNEGRGQVLITSRAQNFADLHLRKPLRLAPPPDPEALAFLLERTERTDASEAEKGAASELAGQLGNLPLALEQAAAYVVTRKVSFADYLASYRKRGLELLGVTSPEAGTKHDPVKVTWSLNIEQVERESPAGADLLRAAAFLAPEAIPDELFLEGGAEISERVGAAVGGGDPLTVAELAAPLLRYSLVERDGEKRTLSLHRLVQEVVKQSLTEAAGADVLHRVVQALSHVFPWPTPKTWPLCERLLPHLLAIRELAKESDTLAELLNYSASYLDDRARFAEAEPLYERSLAIRERIFGKDHLSVATVHNNLAELYRKQGRLAEAEPLYKSSLAIFDRSLGGELDVARSLNNLGSLYWTQGRFSEAERLYERSLAIFEKLLGGDHPNVANSLHNLATVYSGQGRFAEAERLYQRSLIIIDQSLGDQPDVASLLNNLASDYSDQGRLTEAESLFERSLAIREKSLGVDHPDLAQSLENLALLRRKQGRDAEATELEMRAREVRARHEARNSPRA